MVDAVAPRAARIALFVFAPFLYPLMRRMFRLMLGSKSIYFAIIYVDIADGLHKNAG